MSKLPWYYAIAKVFTYVMGALVIYWLLLKLTNHSPTGEQVMFAFIAFITGMVGIGIGLIVKLTGDVSGLRATLVHHIKQNDSELARISTELARINTKLD